MPFNRQKPKSNYVQAIPIYLSSDSEVVRYFNHHTHELDAITGEHITFLLATEIRNSDAAGIAKVLDARTAARYPGLRFGDLPCLWIEDELHGHAILALPHAFEEINQTMRALSDACRQTKHARQIKKLTENQLSEDSPRRSPVFHSLLRGVALNKSTERLLAFGSGIIFVALILLIALFVSHPTPFQYTVFRIVLALAAAGFVSMTPGFINVELSTSLRAGGALAVFAIVYFYAPAALPPPT